MLYKSLWIAATCCAIEALASTAWAQSVPVERWLQISQKTGEVTSRQGEERKFGQVGDRLSSVGDSISTGKDSKAVLEFDSSIGTIQIAENTTVLIQRLRVAPDGGRITYLRLLRGQIRLKVRKFSLASSELQVETPGGVSGVRGTEFGVSVRSDGVSSVATLEGQVAATAQNQEVLVDAGFQTRIVPGAPPLPASPLLDDTRIQKLKIESNRLLTVRLRGRVDPANLVSINQQTIALDNQGNFDVTIPVPPNHRIETMVSTPLGRQQRYTTIFP